MWKPPSRLLPGSRARSAQQYGKAPCLMHALSFICVMNIYKTFQFKLAYVRMVGAKVKGYVFL